MCQSADGHDCQIWWDTEDQNDHSNADSDFVYDSYGIGGSTM